MRLRSCIASAMAAALAVALLAAPGDRLQDEISRALDEYSQMADQISGGQVDEVISGATDAAGKLDDAAWQIEGETEDFKNAMDSAKRGAASAVGNLSVMDVGKPEDYGLSPGGGEEGVLSSLISEIGDMVDEVRALRDGMEAKKRELERLVNKVRDLKSDGEPDWADREWIVNTFGAGWQQYEEMWLLYHGGTELVGEHVCDDECGCRADHEYNYSHVQSLYSRMDAFISSFIDAGISTGGAAEGVPE